MTFDPFAHARDVRAQPESYFHMSSIVAQVQAKRAIKRALTLADLNKAFQPPAKAAKDAGDTEGLAYLTEAAQKRRKELEK